MLPFAKQQIVCQYRTKQSIFYAQKRKGAKRQLTWCNLRIRGMLRCAKMQTRFEARNWTQFFGTY